MAKLKVTLHLGSRVRQVGDTSIGEVFRFFHRIHQSNGKDDVYVRVHASDSYQPIPGRWDGKISVVNLTRSQLSLVEPHREIITLEEANLEVR